MELILWMTTKILEMTHLVIWWWVRLGGGAHDDSSEHWSSFCLSPCPRNSDANLYVKINLFQIVTDVGYKALTNYKTIS